MAATECLGVDEAIDGLLASGRAMEESIKQISSETDHTPSTAKLALTQITSTTASIRAIEKYFNQDFSKATIERSSLISPDHICAVLTGCVLIYSDLERYIDFSRATLDGYLSAAQWQSKEIGISTALSRLQNIGLLLDSIISIFECASLREAQENQQGMVHLMGQMQKQNANSLGPEDNYTLANKSPIFHRTKSEYSDDNTTLRSRSGVPSISEEYSISAFTGDSENLSTIASTRSSRSRVFRWTAAIFSSKRFDPSFEKDLETSWVYRRAGFLRSRASLVSREGSERGMASSELSQVASRVISSVAVFSLPLNRSDIYNSDRYTFNHEEILVELSAVGKDLELLEANQDPENLAGASKTRFDAWKFARALEKQVRSAGLNATEPDSKNLPLVGSTLTTKPRLNSFHDIGPSNKQIVIGRQQLLHELGRCLVLHYAQPKRSVLILYGVPGSGKTTAAASFAYASLTNNPFSNAIPYVFWVDAAKDSHVVSKFADFARALGLVDNASNSRLTDATTFSTWLRDTGQRWLLILDGLTDWGIFTTWCYNNPQGSILITTRNHSFGKGLDVGRKQIQPLGESDGVLMFNSFFNYTRAKVKVEIDDVLRLVNWVGRIPIGIMALTRFLNGLEQEDDGKIKASELISKKFQTVGELLKQGLARDLYSYIGPIEPDHKPGFWFVSDTKANSSFWYLLWKDMEDSGLQEPSDRASLDLVAPLANSRIQATLSRRLYAEREKDEIRLPIFETPHHFLVPNVSPPSRSKHLYYTINPLLQMRYAHEMTIQTRRKTIDLVSRVLLTKFHFRPSVGRDVPTGSIYDPPYMPFNEYLPHILALHNFFREWCISSNHSSPFYSTKDVAHLRSIMISRDLVSRMAISDQQYWVSRAVDDIKVLIETVKEILAWESPHLGMFGFASTVSYEIAACNYMLARDAMKTKDLDTAKGFFTRCDRYYRYQMGAKFIPGNAVEQKSSMYFGEFDFKDLADYPQIHRDEYWEIGPFLEEDNQHDNFALSAIDAARCMAAVGDRDNAILAITAASQGNDSSNKDKAFRRGHACYLMGSILSEQGQIERAISYQFTARTLFQSFYGEIHGYTATANALLGWSYLRMELHEQAKPCLRNALEGFSGLFSFVKTASQRKILQNAIALVRYYVSQACAGLGDEAGRRDWLAQAAQLAWENNSNFPGTQNLNATNDDEGDIYGKLADFEDPLWGWGVFTVSRTAASKLLDIPDPENENSVRPGIFLYQY